MSLFFVIVAVVMLAPGFLQIWFLRQFNRDWWNRPWLRRTSIALPVTTLVLLATFLVGHGLFWDWLHLFSLAGVSVLFVIQVSLLFSLPLAGLVNKVAGFVLRKSEASSEHLDINRRRFLQGSVAAIPLLGFGTDAYGVGRSFSAVEVEKKVFRFAGLPDDLDGLRLLHLSDLHLSFYVTPDTIARTLADAEKYAPDLILLTGDIADDLNWLAPLLEMVEAAKPRLGSYACLGNHEYFRGLPAVKRIFSASSTPLLIDRGVSLPIGKSSLYLAGIDDPGHMRGVAPEFYLYGIKSALVDRTDEVFTLMMSHRPKAFDYAVEQGVDLTLSGHTHGGQVGFAGRSILEPAFSESYLWGHYAAGNHQLYTSAGAGHWFPYRLGCPAEAPIIELAKA